VGVEVVVVKPPEVARKLECGVRVGMAVKVTALQAQEAKPAASYQDSLF
jgi:hypothetical protein